jgi:hypothetical protein
MNPSELPGHCPRSGSEPDTVDHATQDGDGHNRVVGIAQDRLGQDPLAHSWHKESVIVGINNGEQEADPWQV